ncbi:MAG: hypothetical protein EU548_08960 [Promethearchaeota archaeon]|nr:MAG: hypothetical protein EU548_08960 [Candidatus Lokiarchaeota archaeon]
MKRTRKYYKAIFTGKIKKDLRVDRFSKQEVIRELLDRIPEKDDGEILLYEVDFLTDEKRLQKKILVVSELFIEGLGDTPYIFEKNYNI